MLGVLILPKTRARSRTGPIPGSAATVPRRNLRTERLGLAGVPLTLPLMRVPPSPRPRGEGWGEGCMQALRLIRLVVAITLLLLAAAQPARADEFATLVSALAADSFAEKERAVGALGKLGDERAVAVLTALKDGRLLRAPDGRVLISDPTKLIDPLTGADFPAGAAEAPDRIRVNNRLRGATEAALGELTLFSSDPATRLAAAQDAVRHPSADQAALLEKAIARE